jgi:spore coat polysaccharide biosynthesis predicted glycosyltransferase SpsG
MRFIFRADASPEIGTGHVMRSLVLAEEATSRGYECIFVGEISGLDWVANRVADMGLSQVVADCGSFDPDSRSDVLILDSYSISASDAFISKKRWKLVMSICDEITPKYDVDIELCPSLELTSTKRVASIVLSGPEYILIRNGIEKSKRSVALGEVTKVLIFGGGSDPFGFVREISHIVSSLDLNLEIHIFSDQEIPAMLSLGLIQHPLGSTLDSVASDVDVVLTTASTSSLECIAREIPTGVVCAVDNQEGCYEQLGRLGYASQVGVRNRDGVWEFDVESILELVGSQGKQNSLREATRGLIDLKGASRVIDFLVNKSS